MENKVDVALQLFRRALELEGFSGYSLQAGDSELNFIETVASIRGGLGTLMLASDRVAMINLGYRLWDVAYCFSNSTADGIGLVECDEIRDTNLRAGYKAFESMPAGDEPGLALMIAREAVKDVCKKEKEFWGTLEPVPGFTNRAPSTENNQVIPLESQSDLIAYGFARLVEKNLDLVLELSPSVTPEPSGINHNPMTP